MEPSLNEFVQLYKDFHNPSEWYFITIPNEYQALMNLKARDDIENKTLAPIDAYLKLTNTSFVC